MQQISDSNMININTTTYTLNSTEQNKSEPMDIDDVEEDVNYKQSEVKSSLNNECNSK